MRFGDFAKKVAKVSMSAAHAGCNAIEARIEHMEKLKAYYDRYDDERLFREYKSSSGDDRLACSILLKERGYGSKTPD